ncbi:outer membrane beta-barrel protein [Pedobacter suwonensis]|uniref:outer membrane beta-barrel protein n=1 Tax=Pedobacter suwonensis TaxID=332999 RepID=UPI00369A30EB
MKNSAWYHKLWRDKFNGLPVKDAADASWTGMQKLLNEQMPIGTGGSHGPHLSTGTKLLKVVKIIGYTFSVAAAASTVGYFTLKKSDNKQNEIEEKVKSVFSDSMLVDSNKVLNYDEIADSTIIRDSLNGAEDSLNADVEQNKSVGDDVSELEKPAGQMENSASKTMRANAATPLNNKYFVAKESNRVESIEDLNKISLKSSSKVEVISNTDQKENSLFGKSGKLLSWPKLHQQEVTYIDLPLKIQRIAIPVVKANDFQNSSGNQDNTTRHYDKNAEPKNQKETNISLPKIRTNKTKQNGSIDPKYSYGLTSGMNVQKGNNSFYIGVFGSYAFNKNWQLTVGLNANSNQKIAGKFTHPSYYRPDSVPPLTIATTRKLVTIDIPLAAAYKLSKHIDLKAGPIVSFVGKQSIGITKLNPIVNPRDTLYHSKQIDSIIVNTNTVNNRVNIGITGGISIHIKQFDVNGSYQWLTPYKLSNSLGSFKQRNHFFRIGIGYRFR